MFNNDYYFIALFRYKSLKPLKFLDTIFLFSLTMDSTYIKHYLDGINLLEGFFKNLLDLPVLESFKNIQLQSQFNNILSSNAKYLAHEYLNQSYESFDFAKLVAELSQAKLQFASPAHFARLLKPSYF